MNTATQQPRSAGAAVRPQPAPTRTARCTASDILRWTGMHQDVSERTDAIVFPARCLHAHATLMREGSRFESLYFVGAGTFRCLQSAPEGTEQVQEFATKGDVLGLEGVSEGSYCTSAVALEESMVAVVPFRDLVDTGHEAPALERMLHRVESCALVRKVRVLQIMSTARAEVRVARFLLEWASRQAALGYSPRRLRMRMTRRDIATHLGVAHETVSRSFSLLASWGLIKVGLREIEILDPSALRSLHGEPRGAGDGRSVPSVPMTANGQGSPTWHGAPVAEPAAA
jgi:CRP/FNR family transcriptional regulator